MTKGMMDMMTRVRVTGRCLVAAATRLERWVFLLGRWVFLSLFTCQSSPHVRALLLQEMSSDIYTPTNKLVQ